MCVLVHVHAHIPHITPIPPPDTSIPCPSSPFPPPHLTTNQMLHRNCPADTLLQEVIMVRHLLHKVPVSLYHKSTTGTHSFSNYRHIPHYSTFILCTYI